MARWPPSTDNRGLLVGGIVPSTAAGATDPALVQPFAQITDNLPARALSHNFTVSLAFLVKD